MEKPKTNADKAIFERKKFSNREEKFQSHEPKSVFTTFSNFSMKPWEFCAAFVVNFSPKTGVEPFGGTLGAASGED
jgi:hypothetical protein